MAPTRKSSSSCKNRSASSTTTTIEVREAITVILLIAFTLPFFYIIGIWLGSNVTLSTSTEKIHETSLRSSSSSNNNQAATIIDHPVGINSEDTGQISSSRGSLARKMCMLCQNIASLQLRNDSNIIWAIGTIKQIGN